MRIVFSYLQIDAMLKQLHINGLVLCNHLTSTLDLSQHILSFLGTFQKLPLRGALEAPRVCHSLECEFTFSISSKEGFSSLSILTRTTFADENLKASTPPSDDFLNGSLHCASLSCNTSCLIYLWWSVGLHDGVLG